MVRHERLYPVERTIHVAGEQISVPPLMLLLWASLTRPRLKSPPANVLRFPVVVDPGFSHNLYLRAGSAEHWAGLSVNRTTRSGTWEGTVADGSGYLLTRLPTDLRVEDANGTTINCPRFAADLWLYATSSQRQARRLTLEGGISLVPSPTRPNESPGPRIPLLGGLALHANEMKEVIDYKNLDFSLDVQV